MLACGCIHVSMYIAMRVYTKLDYLVSLYNDLVHARMKYFQQCNLRTYQNYTVAKQLEGTDSDTHKKFIWLYMSIRKHIPPGGGNTILSSRSIQQHKKYTKHKDERPRSQDYH